MNRTNDLPRAYLASRYALITVLSLSLLTIVFLLVIWQPAIAGFVESLVQGVKDEWRSWNWSLF
ncbi:hypothetical protein [Crossiella sp. CA198]|uniref:hypothetical protein n=1 Tax=Crossiella sp. CA198 TaxID=3455607 RepID=UPI003F8D8AEF